MPVCMSDHSISRVRNQMPRCREWELRGQQSRSSCWSQLDLMAKVFAIAMSRLRLSVQGKCISSFTACVCNKAIPGPLHYNSAWFAIHHQVEHIYCIVL